MGGVGAGELEPLVRRAAESLGLPLGEPALLSVARHAAAVLAAPEYLHLTAIRDPAELVERHVAEAFQGAALLAPDIEGLLVDLGSGNGYPGLPIAAARPGLRPLLVEAAPGKAEFLRAVVAEAFPAARILASQVQRPQDLGDDRPIDVLVTRAMGGWEKIVPRLAPALSPTGQMLVWAGEIMERVVTRSAWRRLTLRERRKLAGRERSWIWQFVGGPTP